MATKTRTSRKTEVKPALLNVAFVWDMSGSMGIIEDAAREGTGGYIADLQAEEKALALKHGESIYTRFSLTAFDTVFEPWVVDEPIGSIKRSELMARYEPRGGTALYDAIANTIADLDSRLGSERSDEKCLVIIMTDGEENSSKEYALHENGRARLLNLIKAYEAKGNWTFVYLGANVDAYAEAAAIGIPAGNAAYYSSTPGSVIATASAMSFMTSSRRSAGAQNTSSAFEDAGLSQDYRDDEEDK